MKMVHENTENILGNRIQYINRIKQINRGIQFIYVINSKTVTL